MIACHRNRNLLLFMLISAGLVGCTEWESGQAIESKSNFEPPGQNAQAFWPATDGKKLASLDPDEMDEFWQGQVAFGDNHVQYELSDGEFHGRYGG